MNSPRLVFGEHTLPNGRKYRLLDHGEYMPGEYPTGGIHICCWESRIHDGKGGWLYVDNAPDKECAMNFLEAAARLPATPEIVEGRNAEQGFIPLSGGQKPQPEARQQKEGAAK